MTSSILRLACGLACVAYVVDAAQSSMAPPLQAASYSLVFADEFDSVDLSSTAGPRAHTWSEGVWFNKRHAPLTNITASNSVLSLKWEYDQKSFDTSISSFSKTENAGHSWRYGYFEARMKWDVVTGAWPAFWLIPVEDAVGLSVYKGTRESGEIDVFEGQGDHPHTYYGTVHDWVNLHSKPVKNNHFALAGSVDLSQFHVYGMLWTPGHISWYLDNRLLHTERAPAILDKQHFFVILGMQEGVNWEEGNTSAVAQPAMTLGVDWIRVWQK